MHARPLNSTRRQVTIGMYTVARVAAAGIYTGRRDDPSGGDNWSLQPESWLRFGIFHKGIDLVCSTVAVGWDQSPTCYHGLIELTIACLRSRGIPVFACTEDTRYRHGR